MQNNRRTPFILLCCITALVICITWSKIIFHPNEYLLCTGGDAFKNYFTPAWYVQYDHGIHFTGMNYPYGEHVVFTDDQPVISGMINFVDDHIYPVADYTVGILNILMFLSLFFCVIFIYKIMVHYKLPPYYALAAAPLIGLMNPQLERFWGHFALTYCVYIPMLWYLIIQMKKYQYPITRVLLTIAVMVFFGFIHMYFILIGGMLVFFYLVAAFFREKKNYRQLIALLAAGIIPLLCITGFMHFTDHVVDRPQSPYGFFRYKATFQSVFLPRGGTIHNQVFRLLHLRAGDPEGYAFVGTTGFFFLFILAFIFVKRWIYKKRIGHSFINMPGDLGTWLIAGFCMLLFSMTLPFSLGMQFLLEIISPLKQFRSPGRFAWGFYYTYTISLSVIIYLLFKKIKRSYRMAAYAFISVFALIQFADCYTYFTQTAKGIQKGNAENPFVKSNTYFTDIFPGTGYTPSDFDAMLYLPAFFEGSEKLYVDRSNGSLAQAMEIAWHTGLPLVDQMMSRTSFSQTLNNVALISHPYIENNSASGVFTAKKLLVVTTDRPMQPGEQYIIDHSVKFASKGGFNFYAFDMDAVKEKGNALAEHDYAVVKDSLKAFPYNGGTYYSEHVLRLFYRDGFENSLSRATFSGNGSFTSDREKKVMADIPVDAFTTPYWIEISFWALSDIHTMAYPYIEVAFVDGNGQMVQATSVAPTQTTDVMNGWVRASANFEMNPATRRIRITCSDDSPVNFDELVVRHTGWNAYYDVADSTRFIVNNFIIGK